jgi:hypothetical protein
LPISATVFETIKNLTHAGAMAIAEIVKGGAEMNFS